MEIFGMLMYILWSNFSSVSLGPKHRNVVKEAQIQTNRKGKRKLMAWKLLIAIIVEAFKFFNLEF